MPCPEDVKDISDLDPYIKVKLDADQEITRETKKKKDTGPNVTWNEEINFGKVEDNLAFLTFLSPCPWLRLVSWSIMTFASGGTICLPFIQCD